MSAPDEQRRAAIKGQILRLVKGGDMPAATTLAKTYRSYDLWPIDLSGEDLSEANLSDMDLGRMRLRGADLTRAKLYKTNLGGADLTGARMRSAIASKANFGDSDLTDADLGRAALNDAEFDNANLNRADFSYADLVNARLYQARCLQEANFIHSTVFWADLPPGWYLVRSPFGGRLSVRSTYQR